MKRLIVASALIVVMATMASAQDREDKYLPQGYIFAGEGSVHTSGSGTRGLTQAGAGGEVLLSEGFGIGGELGVIGRPQHGSGIFSIDPGYRFRRHSKLVPFVEGGYSRTFARNDTIPTTNFFNLGGGINYWVSKRAALRLEFRDHLHGNEYRGAYAMANQYWDFRIGLTFR